MTPFRTLIYVAVFQSFCCCTNAATDSWIAPGGDLTHSHYKAAKLGKVNDAELVWSYQVPSVSLNPSNEAFFHNGNVYFVAIPENAMYVVGAKAGDPKLKIKVDTTSVSPQRFTIIDPVENVAYISMCPLGDNGTLSAISLDGNLKQLWSITEQCAGSLVYASKPGRLVSAMCGSATARTKAWDKATGKEIENFEDNFRDPVVYLAMSEDNNRLFGAIYGSAIKEFDVSNNGSSLWSAESAQISNIWSRSFVISGDKALFVNGERVTAVDINTKAVAWTLNTGKDCGTLFELAADGTNVYHKCATNINVISLKDGTLVNTWKTRLDINKLIVLDDAIFVAFSNGFQILDKSNGQVLVDKAETWRGVPFTDQWAYYDGFFYNVEVYNKIYAFRPMMATSTTTQAPKTTTNSATGLSGGKSLFVVVLALIAIAKSFF